MMETSLIVQRTSTKISPLRESSAESDSLQKGRIEARETTTSKVGLGFGFPCFSTVLLFSSDIWRSGDMKKYVMLLSNAHSLGRRNVTPLLVSWYDSEISRLGSLSVHRDGVSSSLLLLP